MIAIFCAMEVEARIFRNKMKVQNREDFPECRVWQGKYQDKGCLLVLSGAGKKRAERAALRVIEEYPLELIISTGLGGALNDKTQVGDVVVYARLKNVQNGTPAETAGLECEGNLIGKAMDCLTGATFKLMTGTGVTTRGVCDTADAKQRLGEEYQADMVDMESFWIAQAAAAKGIPFLGFRAISDDVQDDLTLLSRFTAGDKIAPGKAVRQIVLHPGCMKDLVGYYRDYRRAGNSLAQVMDRLMEGI